MVAHTALAIIAVVALLGGTAAVADTGAFSTASAGNMNLGTLSPGQNGTAKVTTSITVANSSEYKLQKTMEDRIGSVFSSLQVSVSLNGQTYNLTRDEGASHVYLKNGTYKVTVNLKYHVRNEVHSANVTGVPFLFLQQAENETADNESGFIHVEMHGNDTGMQNNNSTGSNDTETGDSAPAALPYDDGAAMQNNSSSGRMVLATMTFHVNGNAGDMDGNDAGTARKTEESIAV